MALVRETRIGGPNGAIVRIWDDDYAHLSKSELEARQRERGEAVRRMLENQIRRGITPTIRKLEVPEKEVLYERE